MYFLLKILSVNQNLKLMNFLFDFFFNLFTVAELVQDHIIMNIPAFAVVCAITIGCSTV